MASSDQLRPGAAAGRARPGALTGPQPPSLARAGSDHSAVQCGDEVKQSGRQREGSEELIDSSRNGGFVSHLCAMGTLLFVLSFALLAVQTSATLPLSHTAIQRMTEQNLGDLKAQAVNRMVKKHMLAEEGTEGKEVVGFGGMHYKRTKEEEEEAKQGPSFTDVICVCLCCYIYDKFIDKDKPVYNEEVSAPAGGCELEVIGRWCRRRRSYQEIARETESVG
eukprot:753784-Hanusia_phi.AAC.8